jgi:N-methylhydantoinase B
VIPDGSFLKPHFPAACAMWPTPSSTIPDLFLKALAPAIPDLVRGGHFGDSMANFIYGIDPTSGKYYVCAEADAGGYGGKPTEDGECALFSMTLGDTYNVPAEVVEVRYPWQVERFELRRDSGGAGKYRGGLGVVRDYRLGFDAGLTVTTDRVKYTPPWGVFGGSPGDTNITVVTRNDGAEERWRKISNLPLKRGEVVSFRGGGGGGYGSPLDRDPQAVLDDVISGYVSVEAAARDYGVAIDVESRSIDAERTKALRMQMRAQGAGG